MISFLHFLVLQILFILSIEDLRFQKIKLERLWFLFLCLILLGLINLSNFSGLEILSAFGFATFIAFYSYKIHHRDQLGGADVLVLIAITFILALKSIIFIFFLLLLHCFVELIHKLKKKQNEPYPFIPIILIAYTLTLFCL